MPGVKTPNFELSLGGVDFSANGYKKRVRTIEVTMKSDDPSSFKITIDDCDDAFVNGKLGRIIEGDECVIKLGYYEKGLTKVIHGYVTSVKKDYKQYNRKNYIVEGYDGLDKFTRGRKQRAWDKIKDSDIAIQIAQENGLGSDYVVDSKIVCDYVAQNNQNDLTFLNERAKRYGFEVAVIDRQLAFRPINKNQVSDIILRYDASKADANTSILSECKFDARTENLVKKVVVRGYDPKTAKPILASASSVENMDGKDTAAEVAAYYGVDGTLQVCNQSVASAEEAEEIAKSELNKRSDEFYNGTGKCEGNAKMKCGVIVKVLDIGDEMEGKYIIKSCTHTMDASSGFSTSFEIGRNSHGKK